MPIPVSVESEDDLPEGLAEYYEQTEDGTYILGVEGVDNHPEVHGLKSSLQKQKADREKLRKERDTLKQKASLIPDDLDTETLQQVIERIQNGDPGDDGGDGKGGKGKGEDPAKIREQIEKRYQDQVDELKSEAEKKAQQVQNLVVDNGLTSALQKHGVTTPGLQKGAKRLLADQVKVQEDEDGSPRAIVDTDMGEVDLDSFVKDWVSSDEGQDYLPKTSGSGATGSGPNGKGGKKEMPREKFDALEPEDRAKFIKDGGKIIS